MAKRAFIIVADSFGIGELPDAEAYGDKGSNTLAAISGSGAFSAPNLKKLGLFNIDGVSCGKPEAEPAGSFARAAEMSAGKDTTIGHWEIAGHITLEPLPTYPEGFPDELMRDLAAIIGRGVLCGKPYSGTSVIADYGAEHMRTSFPIVYTSADSVMQIAAHEEIISIGELYNICGKARAYMTGKNGVGRIIARPFDGGEAGGFKRTANRKDFSLPPPGITMLDVLSQNKLDVISVGKIYDIFAGRGITRSVKTANNSEGMEAVIQAAKDDFSGLCFVNLVDFDMLYGHRNDIDGYAGAISLFDSQLAGFIRCLRPEDIAVITADHGCDPSTESTDHSREYTPVIIFGEKIKKGVNLGTLTTMSDIAATVLDWFGLSMDTAGKSFLGQIV